MGTNLKGGLSEVDVCVRTTQNIDNIPRSLAWGHRCRLHQSQISRVDDNNFSGTDLGDWQLNVRDLLLDIFFFDLPGFLLWFRIYLLGRVRLLLTGCDDGCNRT